MVMPNTNMVMPNTYLNHILLLPACMECWFASFKVTLTHCVLVDSSTFICWMSPFVILGASGLFFSVILFFDGKSC